MEGIGSEAYDGADSCSTLHMACPECGGSETVAVVPTGCDEPVVFVCKNCWPDKVVGTYQFRLAGWFGNGDSGSAKGMPPTMPDLELGLGNTT